MSEGQIALFNYESGVTWIEKRTNRREDDAEVAVSRGKGGVHDAGGYSRVLTKICMALVANKGVLEKY